MRIWILLSVISTAAIVWLKIIFVKWMLLLSTRFVMLRGKHILVSAFLITRRFYFPCCSWLLISTFWVVGNGRCDGDLYNTIECGWDGEDCLDFNDKYGGNCTVANPYWLEDSFCHGDEYNTEGCNNDNGACKIETDTSNDDFWFWFKEVSR